MMYKVLNRLIVSVVLIGSSLLVEQIVPNSISIANAQGDPDSGVVNTSDWFKVPRTGLMYHSQTGRCVSRSWNVELQKHDRVVQDLPSCRKTWYAIVRAGEDAILFYDRLAGDIEVYEYTSERGIGSRLHKYSGFARKTWRKVKFEIVTLNLNPGQSYTYHIRFTDDNGQKESYGYNRSIGLFRR